jgi:hypothetical protein
MGNGLNVKFEDRESLSFRMGSILMIRKRKSERGERKEHKHHDQEWETI